MRKKKSIKKDDIVPEGLQKTVVAQKITSDFVLELYEKSKKLRGKKKKELLAVAEELSKHVGKYLAE